jgi:hypothetical protein
VWILLLLPFVGLLWVPFYNFLEPALFGFPFFYWYQLAWVPISSLLIWLVFRQRTQATLSPAARWLSNVVPVGHGALDLFRPVHEGWRDRTMKASARLRGAVGLRPG